MEKIEIFCCGKMETKQWKKAYIDQLTRKEEKGLGVYRDMDTSYTDKDSRYYAQLTAFLNKREDDLSDKLCGKYEYKFNQVEGKLHGIVVSSNGEKIFTLRSDLFGFSAPELNWREKNNFTPYELYLMKNCNEKNSAETVVEWIMNTRTLGGAFLWPIKKYFGKYRAQHKTQYNLTRGGHIPQIKRQYIQDRVDLTLLEIKHSYDAEYGTQYTSDLLCKQYQNSSNHIQEWLQHFKNFPTYIEFFCLDGFVDKDSYMPWDLVALEHGELCDNARSNQGITEETDIQKMCNFLAGKIKERSEKMYNKMK